MHEVSIVSELIEIVEENAKNNKLSKIDNIKLNVGDFTCVEESAIIFAFSVLSKGTLCEGAKLIINNIQPSAYCDNCQSYFNVSFTNKICPICKIASTKIKTGYELTIESIEGE